MAHQFAVVSDRSDVARPPKRRDRMTPNDRIVLGCLEKEGRPMKAYDLLECVREQGINAPMTVYRALSRLTAARKVKKIESLNAFYAIPEDREVMQGAFLLCGQCGAVSFKPIGDQVLRAMLPMGVELEEAAVELTTSCFGGEAELLSGKCSRG